MWHYTAGEKEIKGFFSKGLQGRWQFLAQDIRFYKEVEKLVSKVDLRFGDCWLRKNGPFEESIELPLR